MEPALELVRVSKEFGGRKVLNELSLTVAEGETLAIVGPSGTGKTVLLKHLIGLVAPDSGALLVEGLDFWSLRQHEQARLRRRYGIAFQEGALFDSMSVFDNVAFPLRRERRLSPAQVRARVRHCLSLVRLPGIEGRRPAELSTGMRRRVGFARAIALEPEILLFDEPTAALDPVMVTVLNEVIRGLTRTLGCTTVLVTHDLPSARAVAGRMALLFKGRILAEAATERFFDLPAPEVQQFVHGRAEGPILDAQELSSGSAR
jgi:phospholipid/cholesterol/gamma-HCH transport system ATP-binding protein